MKQKYVMVQCIDGVAYIREELKELFLAEHQISTNKVILYADIVINQKTNTVVKCRMLLEDLIFNSDIDLDKKPIMHLAISVADYLKLL
jgi:hypothetical protein